MKTPLNVGVRGSLWPWHGRSVEQTGIGASEEMIVQLSEKLASRGHPANVYGPTPEHDVHNRVGYWKHPQLRFAEGDKIIVSRAPSWGPELDKLARRKLKKSLWLQDAHYGDLNEKSAADYEKIVVVSNWHKEAMHEQHGVPLEQMEVIHNWLLPEHFATCAECDEEAPPERRPHHFIYASSPDRGLITLLRLWPDILKVYPDASLDIFYGWKGCMKLGQGDAAWIKRFIGVREEYNRLRWQSGVTERGMVPHKQIAREFQSAAVMAYPTSFLETCCTNALKARAAGCVIVTSPLAGLNETAACAQTRWVDTAGLETISDDYRKRFIDAVVQAVEMPEAERRFMSSLALTDHCFEQRLPAWLKLLGGSDK